MSYGKLMAALALLVGILFCASLMIGPGAIGLSDSLQALVRGRGEAATLVMREIRLPRALLGVMVGAALGASGAAMQGFLRNPLAEPGLIGVTAMAGLGAVIALQTGIATAFALALPLAALAGAFVAALLILIMAGPRGTALALILAGVAISALGGAASALVLSLSPNPFAAAEIVFWTMGSLADRSMVHVGLMAPFFLVGLALLAPLGRGLDALTLGEDAAESMGVRLNRLRLILVAATAALAGSATAVAGGIGFVGLAAPHLLRRAVGGRPSRLIPAAALGGAVIVLAADVLVRVIAPDRDLKLGVMTALIGAPFLLHLIRKARREGF